MFNKRRRMLSILARLVAFVAIAALSFQALPSAADFSSEDQLAAAKDIDAVSIVSLEFTGANSSASVETLPVAGMPVKGSNYLVLSTGEADEITNDPGDFVSTNVPGSGGVDGNDATTFAMTLLPPTGAQCFAFDFVFLSEEYPEFVGSQFNDTFTAEARQTSLTVSNGTVVTPFNFAFDAEGNAVSINTVLGLVPEPDSPFDGATPLLTALTPIELDSSGQFKVFLTIQDLGDSVYDSAVLVDNTRWLFGANCTSGAVDSTDTDGDSLPDIWETDGLDVDGDGTIDLDLPALGADPMRKDIFLEIDWMTRSETTHCVNLPVIGEVCVTTTGARDFTPTTTAVNDVVAAFANAPVANPDGSTGITLHVDTGAMGGGSAIPHTTSLGSFSGGNYDWTAFQALKDAHFDPVRRDVFHYVIYADTYGGSGSSGISRGIVGSDFLVTQGGFGGDARSMSLNQERATLMHEFGHNLGLRHGGSDNENYKPNYLSVMSYSHQLRNLSTTAGTSLIDYSRAALNQLDESALNETEGLAPDGSVGNLEAVWLCPDDTRSPATDASASLDFDCDGSITAAPATVSSDVAGRGPSVDAITTLDGHDDWANIVYSGGGIGQLGAPAPQPMLTPDEELTFSEALIVGTIVPADPFTVSVPPTLLILPGSSNQTVPVTVHNTSGVPQTVQVSAVGVPATPAASAPIPPGESAIVELVVDTSTLAVGSYPVTVTAVAGGGALTAATTVFVPDMADPATIAALQGFLADLATKSTEFEPFVVPMIQAVGAAVGTGPVAATPTPVPVATPTPTPTPVVVGAEFCPGSTTPVDDALPNGGCPEPTEFCPGSTTPVEDALPNGGCPQPTPEPTPIPEPTPAPLPTATPSTVAPTPTALPSPAPVPTAVPVPTIAAPPPAPMPTAPLILAPGSFEFADPYTCGGGFYGTVSGGTPPVMVSYALTGPAASYNLGSFAVGDGAYQSPPGFIDYSVVPDGTYTVVVTAVDSANPANSATITFVAQITDLCTIVNPAPAAGAFVPSKATTGHLVTAPPSSVFVPLSATKPVAVEPSELAYTGSRPEYLIQWALATIAFGALLMGAPMRRREASDIS